MNPTLTKEHLEAIETRLKEANEAYAAVYPGPSPVRQPIHTVYGGAHLYKAETPEKMGTHALRALESYAPTFVDLARVLGWEGHAAMPTERDAVVHLQTRLAMSPSAVRRDQPAIWRAYTVFQRTIDKLKREPVEDYRIDFEDGFGPRPDDEEDAEALRTAEAVAAGMATGTMPPSVGIRIKPLSEGRRDRAIRTLDLFVSSLVALGGGRLPEKLVVTLPKVTTPVQVESLAAVLAMLEARHTLEAGTIGIELMIETPQALISRLGGSALPTMVAASMGRCVAAHFGAYDYTALLDVTAAHQHLGHPACDFARQAMQVALAGTGVWLADGATNEMPIAPHPSPKQGRLTDEQAAENRTAVHRAWRAHADNIRHALANGYYQGWDLHPAQLPIRYAAVYMFFLENLDPAAERLRAFIDQAGKASVRGTVFDDAATGQALLNFFLRGHNCGAFGEAELHQTGLTLSELRSRSFYDIIERRRPA